MYDKCVLKIEYAVRSLELGRRLVQWLEQLLRRLTWSEHPTIQSTSDDNYVCHYSMSLRAETAH